MNLLALDTSATALSLAVCRSEMISHRHELAPRKQSEQLLPWLEALLDDAGLSKNDLHGIACGIGPGTFAGLRLAVSATQALSLGLGIPAVGVSSLQALAHAVKAYHAPSATIVVATLDARQSEIYTRIQHFADDTSTLLDDSLQDPEQWLPDVSFAHDTVIAGSGLLACNSVLQHRLAERGCTLMPELLPDARAVLTLATPILQHHIEQGSMPAPLEPAYVRNKVAETMAERGLPEPKEPPS